MSLKKILILVVLMFKNVYMSDATALELDKEVLVAIEKYSAEFKVEKALVRAVCKKESQFWYYAIRNDRAVLERQAWFTNAVNKYGLDQTNYKTYCSMGTMQVLYVVAYDMGFRGTYEDFMKPDNNIKYGCMLLARLDKAWGGKIQFILSSYNGYGFFDLDGDKVKDDNEKFKNQAYVDEAYGYYKVFGGTK